MSKLIRRDPLDDLFRGFFVKPMDFPGEAVAPAIKMDVREQKENYLVHAEIPGVKKEDIHVTIDGNTVSVSAEVKKASEEKEGDKMLRSERYYGKVFRSFGLGQDVDETQAKAKFENGVLELHLPKKAVTPTRKLTIE